MSLFRPNRRPRRYLAEIVTDDGRLIRRERFTTETAAEAVKVYRDIIAPHIRTPGARRVEIYATADEPNAPPVEIINIY